MKKLSIIAACICATVMLNAQKIKVKDGTVLSDETPIAKIEGKIGLGKDASLTYSTLDGKPILKINEGSYHYYMPVFDDFWWYRIEFPSIGKKMTMIISSRYVSDKKMSEWLFVKITPPLLKNNEIDSMAVNAFITKNDNSEKIKNDTVFYKLYESASIENLKNTKLARDLKQPVLFNQIGGGKNVMRKTTYTYDIYQAKVLIGRLEKVYESDPAFGQQIYYYVYKQLVTPFTVDDKTYDNALAAYTQAFQIRTEIQTFQDKKRHKFDNKFGENSEQQIVQFLITNGYL